MEISLLDQFQLVVESMTKLTDAEREALINRAGHINIDAFERGYEVGKAVGALQS